MDNSMEKRNARESGKQRRHVCTVGRLEGCAYIRLRGRWLEEEAGFCTGDRFNARATGGKLILEKVEG